MWPITSNDGHLSIVRFRKADRERFWYVDPASADLMGISAVSSDVQSVRYEK
jgi:hypothetical protein